MWKHRVDLGIVTYMSFPDIIKGEGPVVSYLETCLRTGDLSVIDVTWIQDPRERKRARDVLRTAGVRVVFSGNPPLVFGGYNLSSCDERLRNRSCLAARKIMDEALFMGAETVYFVSGDDPDPSSRKRALEALGRSVRTLCAYGEEAGLTVALEPTDRDIEHKQLLGPYEEAAEFVRDVRRDFKNFGLIVDQSHIEQLGETPKEVLESCAGFVPHIHLANAAVDDPHHPLYGDKHPPFGVPGSRVGVKELGAFVNLALGSMLWQGKKPSMSLEVKPTAGDHPDEILAQALSDFKLAWAIGQST